MLENNPNLIIKNLENKKDRYWTTINAKEALKLFYVAATRIPAYKEFLKKNKINPSKIKNFHDFNLVPAMSKENYLNVYPYEKFFKDKDIKKPVTIHSTSGSTGVPTYFYREYESDLRREVIIESFFRSNKLTIQGPTLFIITFGMGIWSAGMGIYTAAYLAINRNKWPISIITPGISKIEVLKILRKLAPHYKQIIIAGYAPFVKDVLDEANQEGLNLKKKSFRFIFTGESFPEEFRDYLLTQVGIENIFIDTMNTYGTSELGATAIETPESIFVRRLIRKNKTIFKGLFGNIVKMPTIAQYIPYFVNFDSKDGELFLTGGSPIPLIKYRLGDHGGIFTFTQLEKLLLDLGINLKKEYAKLGLSRKIYELPFVYVYERKNLAVSLYGILIYPEYIKRIFYSKWISKFLTGKFTMETKYDNHQNQYLEINLEMKKNIKSTQIDKKLLLKIIIDTLKQRSSEYRELIANMKNRVNPQLVFWPYEYPEYFAPGNKQKWVRFGKIKK